MRADDVVAVENRPCFVAADFDGDSFRHARVHEVPYGGPAEVVNDEPFIFIPWETVLGLDQRACSQPAGAQAFCHSVRRFVSEKTVPILSSISANIMTRD